MCAIGGKSLYEVDMKLASFSYAALVGAPQPRSAGASTAPAASVSKKDDMAARKLQQAKDAVATLAAVKTKSGDDEKARAAQKVKELKARLQSLKLLYASDPKKLARAAAQIARELAGAVKSYTSAGGSVAELGGVDAPDAPAGGAAAATDKAEEGRTPAEPGSEAEHGEAKADAPADPAKPEDDKQAAASARQKADDEFKNDARALARELKAALRRKDGKHQDDDDQRSGEQAIASVDKALGALPIAEAASM